MTKRMPANMIYGKLIAHQRPQWTNLTVQKRTGCAHPQVLLGGEQCSHTRTLSPYKAIVFVRYQTPFLASLVGTHCGQHVLSRDFYSVKKYKDRRKINAGGYKNQTNLFCVA